MRFPQVVVYEHDGRLKHLLASMVDERRWVLREFRQVEACLKALSAARPAVFVLRLPVECSQELAMLDRIVRKRANIRVVVVMTATELSEFVGLAWDLGADFVIAPPHSLIMLPDIVAGLMLAVTRKNQVT